MDYALYIESMDYEFKQIHESCDREIAYIIARSNEEIYGISPFTESGNGSGGLIGFIKSILDTIVRGLQSVTKTVKGILFGAKENKSLANEKMNVPKNPNLLVKFINGDLQSSKEFLMKASKGEAGYDEVKDFINKQDNSLKQIAGTAMTFASIFGICNMGEKYLNTWQRQIEDCYNENRNQVIGAAEKMARAETDKDKNTIAKQTTAMLLQHMKSVTNEGSNCIENMLRELYAKNYLKKNLKGDMADLSTWKGRRNKHKIDKQRINRAKKEEKYYKKTHESINKGTEQAKKDAEEFKNARSKRDEAYNILHNKK